ncbi:MAG TPA: 2-C-methyl-D-erythritol 2,4-cyclodiphosphate synthase [Candidatus Saccharimonadales bacterium]|nr:2-C-methyl-D-erythritol 2,4-cyclodiphosphate synthase [Candidatus Saccharimonadales bacterium]
MMGGYRVGIGYDIHRLEAGLPLTLGGVALAHERGLVAHSDGDALAHAIGDALLGAMALGDLGKHFPDTDPQFRGMSSLTLLERISGLLRDHGARVVNVDSTLILEAPRVHPHVDEMRGKLAEALGLSAGSVSVKATSNEELGAVGRKEGIAAMAVALVEVDG